MTDHPLSVLAALSDRPWTLEAACASAPYAELVWVYEPISGREPPRSVVKRFEVCATCPVRTECLTDAIGEQRHTIMGVWGGTAMTERTQAVDTLRTQLPTLTEAEIRESAASVLESTFAARLAMWRQRAAGRTPMALLPEPERAFCTDCGQGYLWPDPTARCTRACRKVERILARERKMVA
jgi:hypothetical protein